LLQSVESYRRAIELNGRSLGNRSECSMALWLLGESYASLGQNAESQRALEQSCDLATRLAEANPDVVEYQNQLGMVLRSLGESYAGQEEWDKSQRSWEKALEISRKSQSLSPDSMLVLEDLVTSLCALGELAQRRGDTDMARALRQESILGLEKLASVRTEDPWFSEQLQNNRRWLQENTQH
jgi:tetratricopeptide (TPR) repeat protein